MFNLISKFIRLNFFNLDLLKFIEQKDKLIKVDSNLDNSKPDSIRPNKFKLIKSDKSEEFSSRQKWLLKNRVSNLIECLKAENIFLEPEQALKIFCAADPNSNSSCTQWLIETYCRKGFVWKDICTGKESKVYNQIKLFNDYKSYGNCSEKNIYNYDNLLKLSQTIRSLVRKEKRFVRNQTWLAKKRLKLEKKQKTYMHTCVLVDQPKLKVIVPMNDQSAQWWGQGTRWCTSACENNWFDNYHKQAPLLISLFRDHMGKHRKLQLWINQHYLQWTDENDQSVKQTFVNANWITLKPVIMYILKNHGLFLKDIPDKFKTDEIAKIACEHTPQALAWVPYRLKTKELCLKAAQQNGLCLQNIPLTIFTKKIFFFDRLELNHLFKQAVIQNGLALQFVPKFFITDELCKQAVEKDGRALEFVPKKFKDINLCTIACQQNNNALNYVPKNIRNSKNFDFYRLVINHLIYLPKELRSQEIYKISNSKNKQSLNLNLFDKTEKNISYYRQEWKIKDIQKNFDNILIECN